MPTRVIIDTDPGIDDALAPSGVALIMVDAEGHNLIAVALLEGLPLERAIPWANAAGALCVTRRGAQESLPTRQEIEDLFAESGHA